jgi:hypothetical protein
MPHLALPYVVQKDVVMVILAESSLCFPQTSNQQAKATPDIGAPTVSTCHEMVVIIRPSFKKLCDQDACRAALFNHLLYWIARRAKGQEANKIRSGEVYWYGTAKEICAGLDNSWSVNKVRKEIKALVESGLIGQRHNPVKGWDQTRHYFFGMEQGKALKDACAEHGINLLELGLPTDMLHLLNLVNAFTKSGKCNSQIGEMDLPNMADASPKSGNAIPKITAKETTKKEGGSSPTDGACATTLAQSSLDSTTAALKQEQRQRSAVSPGGKAPQPEGHVPSSSLSGQPQGKPETPGDDIPWGPEKMVRLTECLRFSRNERGAYFSTAPTGKSGKSQRDRQLAAAKKILAEIPRLSQDEYVAAYSEQNNEWWNREKGSLTVEDMAANTPRKVMRTVELLEKVRTRSQSIKRSPVPIPLPDQNKPTQKEPPMTHDQAQSLAERAVQEAKELGHDIQVQTISLDNGAWGIVVRWNTQHFERPETMKSVKRWESTLKEMRKVWDIENRERMKRANNG